MKTGAEMLKNEIIYPLNKNEADFSDCIKNHSGDENIIYKTFDGQGISLSVYYPSGFDKNKKYKTIVFVHGGGWASHKIFDDQKQWSGDHLGFLARYYAQKGFVSVSVDYRLAREECQKIGYQLIDLYTDVTDALRFLSEHKEQYGIDEKNISILGESAGGYLAAAIATLPYFKQHFSFNKVFLINAITSLHDYWHKAVPLYTDNIILDNKSIEDKTELLSPVDNISKSQSEFILIHGLADRCVAPEQSLNFHKRELEIGNASKLYWLPDTAHAFLLAEYTSEKLAAATAVDILNNELLYK